MITYRAINTLNGKFYIGSTRNLEKRKKMHLSPKNKYPFQNALRKYPDAFEWEFVEDGLDEPVLEQALLDMWYGKECCYNLNPIASRPPIMYGEDNPMFGKTHTEEAIRKNREAHTGKVQSTETCENRRKAMMGDKNPMYNKKHTPEIIQALREMAIKRDITGNNNPNYGVLTTEKTCQKISDKLMGKKFWINAAGERRHQAESPGLEWQNGRKWDKGKIL